VERQLFSPISKGVRSKFTLLAARFVLKFSLQAIGATERGVKRSNAAIRRFSAMRKSGSAPIDMLCTYVSGIRTGEGAAYCLWANGHVGPCLCPLAAMADALVAKCDLSVRDTSEPHVPLAPLFDPKENDVLDAKEKAHLFRQLGLKLSFQE